MSPKVECQAEGCTEIAWVMRPGGVFFCVTHYKEAREAEQIEAEMKETSGA